MIRLAPVFLTAALLTGCVAAPDPEPQGPANAGYCASLLLLLDSVDRRMAAQARADMQTAHCAIGG